MQISSQFNRYHHGAILNDMFTQRSFLSFGFLGFKDTLRGGDYIIVKGEDYFEASNNHDDIEKPQTLKNYLKYFDLEYPRNDKEVPLSTKELNSKQVTSHEEFIRLVASNNGFSLKVDDEEWNRTIQMYNR